MHVGSLVAATANATTIEQQQECPPESEDTTHIHAHKHPHTYTYRNHNITYHTLILYYILVLICIQFWCCAILRVSRCDFLVVVSPVRSGPGVNRCGCIPCTEREFNASTILIDPDVRGQPGRNAKQNVCVMLRFVLGILCCVSNTHTHHRCYRTRTHSARQWRQWRRRVVLFPLSNIRSL